jgi:hypothetical protein
VQVNWKSFGVGALIAASMAVLQLGADLPVPYSTIANVLLVLLANVAPSPFSKKSVQ